MATARCSFHLGWKCSKCGSLNTAVVHASESGPHALSNEAILKVNVSNAISGTNYGSLLKGCRCRKCRHGEDWSKSKKIQINAGFITVLMLGLLAFGGFSIMEWTPVGIISGIAMWICIPVVLKGSVYLNNLVKEQNSKLTAKTRCLPLTQQPVLAMDESGLYRQMLSRFADDPTSAQQLSELMNRR